MKSGRKGLQIVLKHVKPSQHVLTVQGGGSDVVRFEYGCVGQGHKAFSRGLWLGFNVTCLFYPASLGEDEASHFAGRLFFVRFLSFLVFLLFHLLLEGAAIFDCGIPSTSFN